MNTKKQCLLKYVFYAASFNRRQMRCYKQKIDMFENNDIIIPQNNIKNININVIGKNNKICIKNNVKGNINIYVFGDNNTVCIDENVWGGNLNIEIGQNHHNFGPVHDCNVKIGKNTKIESAKFVIKNSNAKINIGHDCMFAFDITLYHTDSHPVFDLDTHKIINKVKQMNIGNHVWIGANVTILKNTQIADDCIIGWGSVVSGSFAQEHCVIAGNPGKVVRTNITWDSDGTKGYISNE